ncbi:MAG: ATPase domain-containing protein, partial [bacterium]|nr:ATPase domain-containing protein [bacterium]
DLEGGAWTSVAIIKFMANLMQTGVPGLDEVLCGGFIAGSSILIEGPPGSGKTNLGLQIVFNGATKFAQPGVIVTFEEFPEQIYCDAAKFGWDLKKLEAEEKVKVIHTSPSEMQQSIDRLPGPTASEVHDAIFRLNAKWILLDSVSHFVRVTNDVVEQRELLFRFQNQLKQRGLTVLLTKELEEAESSKIYFEEYVVDASVRLYNPSPSGVGENLRSIEVRKTRGQEHLPGRHPFRFFADGIRIFPRQKVLAIVKPIEKLKTATRIPVGVPGLDTMLRGGLLENSTTLAAGPAGSGKTFLAAHFLTEGIKAGEACLYVTLEETPDKMLAYLPAVGLDLSKKNLTNLLHIHHAVPINLCLEELFLQLQAIIAEKKIKRVVIDSLSDFAVTVRDPGMLRDYIYILVRQLEDAGVTSLLLNPIQQVAPNFFGVNVADIGYAIVADAIIYLGFVEIESKMHRVISVLKMRGSEHDSELRKLLITENGLEVATRFLGLTGVLSGMPTGKYRETIEEVFQPLFFVEGMMDLFIKAQDDTARKAVADKVQSQVDNVITKLGEYFDIDPRKIKQQ